MAGGLSDGRGTISEINVTPLVDVMLVLLIVFMVTTPIIVKDMMPRQLDVNLPATDSAPMQPDPDNEAFIVQLHSDFRVTVPGTENNKKPLEIIDCSKVTGGAFSVCLEPFQRKLGAILDVRKDLTVLLAADRALPYGFVIDVMARVRGAGVTRLGMITDPPERPGK